MNERDTDEVRVFIGNAEILPFTNYTNRVGSYKIQITEWDTDSYRWELEWEEDGEWRFEEFKTLPELLETLATILTEAGER